MVPSGAYKKGLDFAPDSIAYNYCIGKYEITAQQYVRFINEALIKHFIYLKDSCLYYTYKGDDLIAESSFKIRQFDDKLFLRNDSIVIDSRFSNHPITGVTWFGAKAFCEFYHFNLPNEREWEKAARGNQNYWFPWGNEIDSTYANYYNSNDPFEPGTVPVGFYNGKINNGFNETIQKISQLL